MSRGLLLKQIDQSHLHKELAAHALAEKGFYFTGGSIILDHGHGVSTIYAHLDEILVRKNELIKKGQVIGKVGSTGRATGPHLHFGVNWFDTKIDPELILK